MAAVKYTAQRSLIAGHSVGVEYDLQLALNGLTRSRATPNRQTSRSLGGQSEVVYYHGEAVYSARLKPTAGSATPAIHEFLDSVEAGETFQIDLYGTVGDSPNNLQDAELLNGGYTEQRVARKGNDAENTDLFSIPFAFRLI